MTIATSACFLSSGPVFFAILETPCIEWRSSQFVRRPSDVDSLCSFAAVLRLAGSEPGGIFGIGETHMSLANDENRNCEQQYRTRYGQHAPDIEILDIEN